MMHLRLTCTRCMALLSSHGTCLQIHHLMRHLIRPDPSACITTRLHLTHMKYMTHLSSHWTCLQICYLTGHLIGPDPLVCVTTRLHLTHMTCLQFPNLMS